MNEQKKALRGEVRARQREMTEAYARSAGDRIQERILASAGYREAGSVLLYLHTALEPATDRILRQALADGKRVYVPKCVGREMLAVRFNGTEGLRPGAFGIPEPETWAETATADALDLILVPCLAASPDGRRLGHGGGYYDRFLAGKRGKTVCLCFRRMMMENIPMGEQDIWMDEVVTE